MKRGINNTKILCLHLRGIGWTEVWQTYCKDKHSDTGETVKSPRGHRTRIGQMSIYPTPLKQRNWLNQFSNLTGKFTVNCISIYIGSECMHACAEAVHVYWQRLHIFAALSEWFQSKWIGPNAGFQQQLKQHIQSGGRTVSTAHSAIQTKGLHSESTKPGNTHKHRSCPQVHKSS